MPARTLILTQETFFADPGAQVMVNRQVDQDPISRHRHEFSELVVVLSGEGLHEMNGYRHRIGKGDVLFIREQATHAYEETRALNIVNLLINGPALDRLGGDLAGLPGHAMLMGDRPPGASAPLNRIHLEEGDLEQVGEWIDRMEAESATPGSAGYILAEAFLKLIFILILHRLGSQSRQEQAAPDRLPALISWIEAHLSADLPVPMLAKRAGLSQRSLHRRFRERMGTSPADFVLQARLRRAAHLLQDEGKRLSCAEIAARCGFRDPNYFSTAFRRAHGCSPVAFRRQCDLARKRKGARPNRPGA